MKISDSGELSVLRYIKAGAHDSKKDVLIGIGDDAAAIHTSGKELLITTDLMTEGVHFDLSYFTHFHLGFKLISINVSDIYAMDGTPSYALLNLSFGPQTEESRFKEFMDGVFSALNKYGVTLIGGDISSSAGGVTVSATILGFAEHPIQRSTAQPGDKIYVTGNLGDAACGMLLLKRFNEPIHPEKEDIPKMPFDIPMNWSDVRPLAEKHLSPVVNKFKKNGKSINAMMDISDGISIDLKRLCTESGVGARVYEELLPVSTAMRSLAPLLGADPLTLCLCGGEDYELLMTSHEEISNAICIGEITEKEIIFIDSNKREKEWPDCGYEHFKSTTT